MFNSHREPMTSLAGRECKPTAKVKRLLVDSVGREMRLRSRELDQLEKRLFASVEEGDQSSRVRSCYDAWRTCQSKFKDASEQLSHYLEEDELRVHDKIMVDKLNGLEEVQTRVDAYLSTFHDEPPLTPMQAAVKKETRRLEEEIERMSIKLERATASLQSLGSANTTMEEEEIAAQAGPPMNQSTPKTSARVPLFSSPGSIGKTETQFVHPLFQFDALEEALPYNASPTLQVASAKPDPLVRLAELLERKRDRLPQLEPEVFGGELLQYPLWLQSFETLIEKNTDSVTDRLFFLGKYTTGPARECIAGFLALFSEDAYLRAKSTLNARYGDKIRVAEAYRRKLYSWPTVKKGDAVAIQKLADFLWQCQAAMVTVGHLSTLNSAEEISKIMKVLPTYLSERWNRVVDRWYYQDDPDPMSYLPSSEGQYPPFKELCRFISKEARISNGPGRFLQEEPRSSSEEKSGSSFGKHKKSHVFATSTDTREEPRERRPPVCYYCEQPHVVTKCDQFMQLPKSEKETFAKAQRLCFGCLSKRHTYRECRKKRPEYMQDGSGATKTGHATTLKTQVGDEGDDYYSLIVPVEICSAENPSLVRRILVLLDTQSDSCFVTKNLAQSLDMNCQKVKLHLTTMGSSSCVDSSLTDELLIHGFGTDKLLSVGRSYTRESIPFRSDSIPRDEDLMTWPHLSRVTGMFPSRSEGVEVDMLIGFNCPDAFFVTEYLRGRAGAPYALNTGIGWGVMGQKGAVKEKQTVRCLSTSAKEVSMAELTRALDLDFQCDAEVAAKVSQEDMSFLKQMSASAHLRQDGHYETDLPFREPFPQMEDNKDIAVGRLRGLKKKMLADPEYCRQYQTFMRDLIDGGSAARVTKPSKAGRSCYTPHHGVKHPRKPGKIRAVCNFSAEKNGESLNGKLLSGPDLTNNLIGVICRFRDERVAFMCDIKGMFLQVYVTEHHRDYLKFLWFENHDPNAEVVEYHMLTHPFGAKSSPSCANYILQKTADDNRDEFGEEVVTFVKRGFYVDDGLGSRPTVDEVVQLFMKAHELCRRGGFYLHKFTCNEREALEKVPLELLAQNLQTWELAGPELPIESSLGLLWEMTTDCFIFMVRKIVQQLTRRGFLSALSSLYDPVGFIAPVVLVGRIVLQQLCSTSVTWDEPVPEEYLRRWTDWYEQLQDLSSLKIPRCYRFHTTGEIVSRQLHHFCDASTEGYGTCSYLRIEDASGAIDVSLVAAKARVTPKKVVTIPRLELQAAVLATKLAKFLQQEMSSQDIDHWYWSDSKVALGYLKNASRRFHLYVANRAQYVREHTDIERWNYVRTDENPADLASRGCSAVELIKSDLWWHGPEMLRRTEPAPVVPEVYEVAEDDPEVKKAKILVLSTKVEEARWSLPAKLLNISIWGRAVRLLAVWMKYIDALRRRVRGETAPPVPMQVSYEQDAMRAMVRVVQRSEFQAEFAALERVDQGELNRHQQKSRKQSLRQSSPVYRLDPFVDEDGLLRVGGRINRAGMPYEIRHPLLLPDICDLTEWLVRHYHWKSGHGGRQSTLAAVRDAGFWPVHGRSAVERYTRSCVICRKIRALPVVQKMADLPDERVSEAVPFTYCGVDLCGPFVIKERRTERKKWICVFVCFSSSAVHLEVVPELSTDSFLNAFRRFTGRRGPVRSLHCDRGTNFVGAANELEAALKELDQNEIHSKLLKKSCDWTSINFNFPKASHMGGIWERKIRSFRSVFAAIMLQHKARVNEEVFGTLVIEAESIMNSRPVASACLNDPTGDPPITPARLLTMKNLTALPPPGKFTSQDVYSRRRWRAVQHLASQFWTQWRKDVLPALQARQKWNKALSNLKRDDVVLLVDDQQPRGMWPMAVVDEVYPSSDGLVRKVRVRTADSAYDRPVCKLVYLCSVER